MFLRAPYQNSGESALVRAVKMNNLDKVIEKMKASGDTFSYADMHELKDRSGRSVAVLAAETGQLGKLFDPEFWKSDVEGLKAAWNKIPAPTQKSSGITNDSFAALVASHHQMILKSGAKPVQAETAGNVISLWVRAYAVQRRAQPRALSFAAVIRGGRVLWKPGFRQRPRLPAS